MESKLRNHGLTLSEIAADEDVLEIKKPYWNYSVMTREELSISLHTNLSELLQSDWIVTKRKSDEAVSETAPSLSEPEGLEAWKRLISEVNRLRDEKDQLQKEKLALQEKNAELQEKLKQLESLNDINQGSLKVARLYNDKLSSKLNKIRELL